MQNPILETFERGDLSTARKVLVRRDNEPWLLLHPRDDKARTYEGAYYFHGHGFGECISFPHAKSADAVLQGLAQIMIGRAPKPGQIKTVAASLAKRLTFEPIV